jgi:hypothetical protein
MLRHPLVITNLVIALTALVGCGGEPKKPPKKPAIVKQDAPPPKVETEEDREQKRMEAAHAIVPEGSACLPVALKEPGAPRLELAAVDSAAVICAVDTDESRLLGPVGCWTVDLQTGSLAYRQPAPLPGHGLPVNLDDRCARGYCLPKDAKAPPTKKVSLAWNADGSKVALLAGDDLHIFDAGTKAHEKSFSVRGDKGVSNEPRAVHWVGDMLFVEGADQGPYSAVWAFKSDGTQVGPIAALGAKDDKPISTHKGSFSILDKTRVAVSEQGLSTLTIYEADTGKRTKLVRKLAKPPCKADELDAFWTDNMDAVSAKCKEHMEKNFSTLIGATAVAGKTSFLVVMRGDRTGELGVFDQKTLAEKKAFKLAWCDAGSAAAPAMSDSDALKSKKDSVAAPEKAEKNDKAADKPKGSTRGATKKSEDPDAGGE